MGSPEHMRSSVKRDPEDTSDVKNDRGRDEEEWEGDDKRKHRSKRSGNGEDAERVDSSGRKRSTGDRHETRKRSASLNKMGSDEDEYEAKKESHSKQMKKKQEESALEKLSDWYQDGEAENKHDCGEMSGNRGHARADEVERKKSASKLSDHDSSLSRTKGKDERSHDGEHEMGQERDSRSERRESRQEKDYGSSDQGGSQRRKWDESDAVRHTEDGNYVEKSDARTGKSSDPKNETSRERSLPAKTEVDDSKSRGLDSILDKGTKSHDKEDRQVDSEKSKSKVRSEAPEEDNKGSPLIREDISGKEKLEEHKLQRNPTGRDVVGNGERSFNMDDDGNTWMRDKTRRDSDRSNRSRSPERSGRRHHESEYFEMEYDRSSTFRRKELEKDGYRDDRSKGRDDSWSDRNREREASRDNWKRRPLNIIDKDTKDGDTVYDYGREWELQRHGRERVDSERPQGRTGGRKDGNRTEAVKTSSKYGISNENYDVIEIQTKPFDYGREEPKSTFDRSNEAGQNSVTKLLPNDDEYAYPWDSKARNFDLYGSGQSGEDSKDRFMDDGPNSRDQNSLRDEIDFQAGKARGQKGGAQSSSSGSQPPHGNQEVGSFNRAVPQGIRGNRIGRGGRGRPNGRDSQQVAIPVPMMGRPFGPLGMPPPGAMQQLTPSMSPGPGPPISPGVFIPPFSPPVVWPGALGVDMNLLAVPLGLSPVPLGPSVPRFSPNIGTPPDPAMFFSQPGPGRGGPPNLSGASFNDMLPVGRGQTQEKPTGGWVPPRGNVPLGKAPSRGEQNDYSQNFVDTGMRPQNYIRELELTSVVEDYPELRELIQKKDEIVVKSATAPMYYKCDLREQVLSPEFFGTKFVVILVDPPWEEYVHRDPGVTDHMEYWTFEEIMNLRIEAIADTPSFIFLWVGDGLGLKQGRQCLKKVQSLPCGNTIRL